nr:unnamed protein product [Digitaria exilis]
MEIMTGAMSSLLPKLATLLTDEYKLQRRLRGEIMFLKAELESMQAALEKLSDAPVTENQVRIWARNVRELSYDIEDSIDKFMVRIDSNQSAKPHGLRAFIDRSLKLLTTANIRHRIARDIIDIKALVNEVASRRERYNIDSFSSARSSKATTIDPRLIGIYEETTKLVGISGPMEELKVLLELEPITMYGLKVISVVGVGGLERLVIGIDHGEFQSVVKFSFVSNAMNLIFTNRAMPRLETLELAFKVQETKDFDLGLENLSSLKHAMIRIDCRNSNVNVVEQADATMRMAVSVNPNRPRLDIFRHFESFMLRSDRDLRVPDETEETKEEVVVAKVGPWGGNGGNSCDIKVIPRHLESVRICSGTVINALAFSYWDINGKRQTTQFWGGILGNVNTVLLEASEYLIEVCGTYGPFIDVSEAAISHGCASHGNDSGSMGKTASSRPRSGLACRRRHSDLAAKSDLAIAGEPRPPPAKSTPSPLGVGRPACGTDGNRSSQTRPPPRLAGALLPRGISYDRRPRRPAATTSASKKRCSCSHHGRVRVSEWRCGSSVDNSLGNAIITGFDPASGASSDTSCDASACATTAAWAPYEMDQQMLSLLEEETVMVPKEEIPDAVA